ncbi:MAG: 4-(cytidine 5'-diphospho)-2-C-methyl-D-erythritol kinase [Candidatus Coproplasma sp.]
MSYARVKSFAKVNLTLDITGVNGGYHMIDSVVASIDLADVITARGRGDKLINVTMHGEGSENIDPERNNAVKAARAFADRFDTPGADITVWKNIPVGAGLGGSSADVAGVLKAMAKLYNIDDYEAVKAIADSLGSDCGYILTGGFARISGRGEIVKRIESNLTLHMVLLVPEGGVSTAECYALSDTQVKGAPMSEACENALICNNSEGVAHSLNNDLYKAATLLNSGVEEAKTELEEFAPLGVNMTGSGSGVYTVMENEQFTRYLYSRYRGRHRMILTKTVIPKSEEGLWLKKD